MQPACLAEIDAGLHHGFMSENVMKMLAWEAAPVALIQAPLQNQYQTVK